jgi:hypothetical protein
LEVQALNITVARGSDHFVYINRSDFLFRPELLIHFNEEARAGRFDFVV